MFDNIIIVRSRKTNAIAVYDGDERINIGDTPEDINFAQRVADRLVAEGYKPVTEGYITRFLK